MSLSDFFYSTPKMNSPTSLLDQFGHPIERALAEPESQQTKSLFGNAYSTYIASLSNLELPAEARVRQPFQNHPWVFASAMITSICASQAVYRIYRDKEFQIKRFGKNRRIERKYIRASLRKRLVRTKAAEEDFDHEFGSILTRPNPHQDGSQLFQTTNLWLSLRGECFWVMSKGGSSLNPGEYPDSIYPVSPDLMEPIREHGTRGELVGWRFRVPHWHPDAKFMQMALPLTDVIQFKYANPEDPTRGISRLTAAAMAIETDMSISQLTRRQIQNGAVPRGVLAYPHVLTRDEESDLIEKFEQRHKGEQNGGRPAMLSGGLTYTPTQMSPRDMEFLQQKGHNREDIMAVMGTPKSILGVTDSLNYATQLGMDRGFWEKTLLPQLRIIEGGIDSNVFYNEADSSFGLFDLDDVEALRAGTSEKLDQVLKMTGQGIHASPRVAFEFLGLEVPEYEGDDVALVPGLGAVPLGDLLSGETEPLEPMGDGVTEEEPESMELPVPLLSKTRRKSRLHNSYLKFQFRAEGQFKKRYRGWILNEKKTALQLFDKETKNVELMAILPDLTESQRQIKSRIRSVYQLALEDTFALTSEELGIAVFEIDDPDILAFFDQRLKLLANATPVTVRKNLTKSLQEGILNGESISALRKRIAQVYDISASSAKALSIARTESAGFMSGVRDEMFNKSGVDRSSWSTSADENVRDPHVVFGNSGVHERGFNYLELIGSSAGVLAFPHDLRCTDPSLVISCRCLEVAEG